MPSKPKRRCITPGCPGLWDGERCTVCGRTRPKVGWRSDKIRGTRQQRGYDKAWLKLRACKLKQEPLCEECLRAGKTTVATEVHHRVPFRGRNDPLRLALHNLESLCKQCHQQKTHVLLIG